MEIIHNFVSQSKYGIKCPYPMTPTRLVIHNTANDASAENEISYMIGNNDEVSYHFAVDDKAIVQGIPTNRCTWNAGDGNGKGNREGISIEICYSKSGGSRFMKAEENAAELAAELLLQYGWDISRLTKHQDYSGKYCPHRTLDNGWQRFVNLVAEKMEQRKETNLTREEVLAIIKAYEADIAGKAVSNWAASFWNNAVALGIFDGTMPRAALTREQAAKVFETMGITELSKDAVCPDWARDSWQKAVDLKIFDGTMPRGPLSRAQASVVLDRIGALDTVGDTYFTDPAGAD